MVDGIDVPKSPISRPSSPVGSVRPRAVLPAWGQGRLFRRFPVVSEGGDLSVTGAGAHREMGGALGSIGTPEG
eukprot:2986594-Amphidinium_carterae.1